jgi:hypothetical protein
MISTVKVDRITERIDAITRIPPDYRSLKSLLRFELPMSVIGSYRQRKMTMHKPCVYLVEPKIPPVYRTSRWIAATWRSSQAAGSLPGARGTAAE